MFKLFYFFSNLIMKFNRSDLEEPTDIDGVLLNTEI